MLGLWIIISILAIVIDALTSNLFFICFTAGGIAAIISNFCGTSPMVQAIIFCVVSIIFLIFAVPTAKKLLKSSVPKTLPAEHRYVGRKIRANQDIYDEATILIDSIYWTVKNIGPKIQKGQNAIILGIEGNKFIIKIDEEE